MEIEELRIGNYVLCGGICKVKKISYTGNILLEDVHTHIYLETDIIFLQPIPLTRDIVRLIKGVKVINEAATYLLARMKKKGHTIKLTEAVGYDDLWTVQVDDEKCMPVGGCDVKYLHEIQNFIHMTTGSSIKINL